MRSTLYALLALVILPLGACNLYFSGGGEPDPCDDYADWGGGGAPLEAPLLRNPESGVCESFGWGEPPYPCDGVCGPCYGTDGSSGGGNGERTPDSTEPSPPPGEDEAGAEADRAQAMPSWGYCESYCTGLDEQSCLASDGCRGIYNDDGNGGAGGFLECWQTDFSGPPLVQSCEGLDSFTCSQLDSCIAVHDFVCWDGNSESDALIEPGCEAGFFIACHEEPSNADGCYSNDECGAGYSCNAADVCLPPPGGSGPCPGGETCDAPQVCYGFCVPDNTDPGECDGDVTCESLPPVCEAGTTPGIANGCWTGLCIDLSLCPQASCGEIVGESMCIARDDCSPYYQGVDCSCTPDGCDCADWNFDSCNQA